MVTAMDVGEGLEIGQYHGYMVEVTAISMWVGLKRHCYSCVDQVTAMVV